MLTATADKFHKIWRLTGVGALASALLVSSGVAQVPGFTDENGKQVLSVPAELVRSLRLPGEADEIRRPTGLFMDSVHGEIFVGDSGNNRIVVFDRQGLYRFEFDCADHISTPGDIAVDSQGIVYVYGNSPEGARIVRFDFDGIYLSELPLSIPGSGQCADMVMDDQDRLLLLDDRGHVYLLDADGDVVRSIDVTTSVDPADRSGLVLGSIAVHGSDLYVAASSVGEVLVFDVESGDYLRSIGRRGTLPGELAFPVSTAVLPNGLVTVLDKMRFTVVCYAPSGAFLGEFGGMGFRDGWFYHPSLLVPAGEDRVIVGQILDARVQVCQIPDFIERNLRQISATLDREVGMGGRVQRDRAPRASAEGTVQEAVVR